jgi:RNA polymerase sigma-70 factor (ECF subfamily)
VTGLHAEFRRTWETSKGVCALSAAAALPTKLDCTDEDLIARIREGEEAAFELLYERYFDRVHRFVARRMSNRADTEETVQEVFINVLGSIGSYRGEAPFGAWVFGLTRRTIASRFKRRRHPTVPLDGEHREQTLAETNEPDPAQNYEYRELLEQLETIARTRLTEEQRTLFRLHHLEDCSISQIATQLHKTEDSVKSNLYRTRKILLAR